MPPSYNREPEIAFPRSRFSERVNKGDAIRASTIRKKSISEDVGHNPFDEIDENDPSRDNKRDDSTLLIPPKPAIRSKHKRRKKQAPIPPGSVSPALRNLFVSFNFRCLGWRQRERIQMEFGLHRVGYVFHGLLFRDGC